MFHFRSSNSSQLIWGTDMSSSFLVTCYGNSNSCPLTPVTSRSLSLFLLFSDYRVINKIGKEMVNLASISIKRKILF